MTEKVIIFLFTSILSLGCGEKEQSDKKTEQFKDTIKTNSIVTEKTVTQRKNEPERQYYNIDGMQLSEYEYKDYMEKKNLKDNKDFAKKLRYYYDKICCDELHYSWREDGENIKQITLYEKRISELKTAMNQVSKINSKAPEPDEDLIEFKNQLLNFGEKKLDVFEEKVSTMDERQKVYPLDRTYGSSTFPYLSQSSGKLLYNLELIIKKYQLYFE